jgi:hypothetical protein
MPRFFAKFSPLGKREVGSQGKPNAGRVWRVLRVRPCRQRHDHGHVAATRWVARGAWWHSATPLRAHVPHHPCGGTVVPCPHRGCRASGEASPGLHHVGHRCGNWLTGSFTVVGARRPCCKPSCAICVGARRCRVPEPHYRALVTSLGSPTRRTSPCSSSRQGELQVLVPTSGRGMRFRGQRNEAEHIVRDHKSLDGIAEHRQTKRGIGLLVA